MKRLLSISILMILLFSCVKKEAKSELAGFWQGEIEYPSLKMRIVFGFDKNLAGFVAMPDGSDEKYEIRDIKISGNNIEFSCDKIKGHFIGNYSPEDDIISGSWKVRNFEHDLKLNRVERISRQERPQTPKQPFPYDAIDVEFTGGDNVKLAGTLTIPNSKTGRLPAIILVQGVGGHDRDYTFKRHKPFFVIADYFSRCGFAVLRYDERGIGRSSGDPSRCTTEDFAYDAAGALHYLKSRDDIDARNIGMIGHSEGGTIASLVASKEQLAFIVMLASPGLNGYDYNIQFETSMAARFPEPQRKKHLETQKQVLEMVLAESDTLALREKLEYFYRENFRDLPQERISSSMRRFTSPWFKYNLEYDPIKTISKIDSPILAVFAENDMHVPPKGNMESMKRVLDSNKMQESFLFKRANHFFQTTDSGLPAEYGTLEESISISLLDKVIDWITSLSESQSN